MMNCDVARNRNQTLTLQCIKLYTYDPRLSHHLVLTVRSRRACTVVSAFGVGYVRGQSVQVRAHGMGPGIKANVNDATRLQSWLKVLTHSLATPTKAQSASATRVAAGGPPRKLGSAPFHGSPGLRAKRLESQRLEVQIVCGLDLRRSVAQVHPARRFKHKARVQMAEARHVEV